MDDLDQREAFLLAIFAAPADDLPRLVFADWLDERGETAWAANIREQCHAARSAVAAGCPPEVRSDLHSRGFLVGDCLTCPADLLADPERFRRTALLEHPEWYGCVELKVAGGKIASSKPIGTILTSPVTQRVTRLDLSGAMIPSFGTGPVVLSGETIPSFDATPLVGAVLANEPYHLADFEYSPAVTVQAVEALVGAREARRFTHLDLRYNDLDNDAARAILRSNYLTRLTSLHLFDGNQLRGRTWAALQAKFGDGVVS